jgi:hypothetical protein
VFRLSAGENPGEGHASVGSVETCFVFLPFLWVNLPLVA